jgi:DNA-binding CsgD family transcriptional regulator
MMIGSTDQRLGAVAGRLWEMEDLAEFRAGVLSVMRELIPADIASYNEISREPPAALVVGDPPAALGEVTPARERQFAELIFQNPLAAHFTRTGDASAQRMSDFITRRELHRLELYDLFYRPIGTEHQLAFTVPAEGRLIGITLSRGEPDFDDADRELLDRVRELVVPLYRNLLDRARLQAVLAALDSADAEHAPVAVFVVHGGGALEAVHARAERVLSLLAVEPHVLGELREWAHMRRQRRGILSSGGPLRLSLRTGELLATYVHGDPGGLDAIALHAGRRPAAEVLRALGLTARQARVLELICEGHTSAEIALVLTLSEHTVRHHIEEIYRRLGVRSRAGAASRAAQALRGERHAALRRLFEQSR